MILARFAHRFKQALGRLRSTTAIKNVWHRSYYISVWRDEPLIEHATYIIGNPVRAGLVDTIDAWPFSGPSGMLAASTADPRPAWGW